MFIRQTMVKVRHRSRHMVVPGCGVRKGLMPAGGGAFSLVELMVILSILADGGLPLVEHYA